MTALLVTILIAVLIAAVLIWAIQRFLPGDPTLKGIACLIVVVLAVLWVVSRAGLA